MMSGEGANGFDETKAYRVLASGTEISQYRITEKLGAGGMGEVYLADDTKLNRKVALKFLLPQYASDEEIKARFIREAQAAASLSHPAIITVHEVSEFQGRPFMAMEYVEGKSLREVIDDKRSSFMAILDLAMQIGEGLGRAHEAGIIHRDIKPQNILMGLDGRPKITDFGLAKVKDSPELTKAGTTFGTIAYMSPEQAKGLEVDRRADIFSFGVVLYELVAGQRPFVGDNEPSIINAIVNQIPEPLERFKSGVPEGLQAIVEKALAKDRDERYQHVDDIVADLRRERKRIELTETTEMFRASQPSSGRRRLLPIVIPLAAVAILVALIFILEPFRVEMGPQEEAIAQENTLAIMYFDNLADPADEGRLGEIITDLLITDLSGSEYINVISSQRLYDILEILGREDNRKIDRSVATQVATKAGAKWMLMGSILSTEPEIILTLQLVEVESGSVLASQRISGEQGESVFSIVDRLTVEIKGNLALPASADSEEDTDVAAVTTNSPEAYRHFLEGVHYFRKLYVTEARESYHKAIEYDSTFASAYYWLALATEGTDRLAAIARAMELLDHANEKERYYIRSLYAVTSGDTDQGVAELENLIEHYPLERTAHHLLGTYMRQMYQDPEGAIEHLERAIEIDPLFKPSYNVMSYTYNEMGMLEKSIWAINKYIELAPGEPNPHDTKGDLYAANGAIDKAIESYQRALEIKPDFYYSLFKLGHMYVFKRDYDRADSCYRELSSSNSKDWRAGGRLALVVVPLYQGKFREALRLLDNGLAADEMDNFEGANVADKIVGKSRVHLYLGDFEQALKEGLDGIERSQRAFPSEPTRGLPYKSFLYAVSGHMEEAEMALDEIKRITEVSPLYYVIYLYSAAAVELVKGNPEVSIAHLEVARERLSRIPFEGQYLQGLAYLEAGRLGAAVEEFEASLDDYSEERLNASPVRSVLVYYQLGKAYEGSGWNNKAIAAYEEFLEIWKDADPGLEDIEDARERLANLKGGA
ncbi:protein kinase [Candidatus Eisenbacteria bacterium]|uniref:Protein kinase n=1 Tax=Eiseniibacteriota bacterium TaxID=2212470 RepID=A0ABV6YP99_UNCEI